MLQQKTWLQLQDCFAFACLVRLMKMNKHYYLLITFLCTGWRRPTNRYACEDHAGNMDRNHENYRPTRDPESVKN